MSFRGVGAPQRQAGLRVVAEGASISGLRATLSEATLAPGALVRVEMSFKVPGVARAFDAFGAETIFRPFVPPGLAMVDVHEENGIGMVDMRATAPMAQTVTMAVLPLLLVGAIAFIQANWLAIIVAGVALAVIVATIRVVAEILDFVGIGGGFGGAIVIIAVAIGAFMLSQRTSVGRRRGAG